MSSRPHASSRKNSVNSTSKRQDGTRLLISGSPMKNNDRVPQQFIEMEQAHQLGPAMQNSEGHQMMGKNQFMVRNANVLHQQKRLIMRASSNMRSDPGNRSMRTRDSVDEDYGFVRAKNQDLNVESNYMMLPEANANAEHLKEESLDSINKSNRNQRAKTSLRSRPHISQSNLPQVFHSNKYQHQYISSKEVKGQRQQSLNDR